MPDGFDAACARLNQWRGQMVENFTRAEQAVTESLICLDTGTATVKGAKFPHLLGQRYDRLEALLSAPTPQTGHGKAAHAAIATFRTHDALRTMLCHGVTKLAVDRGGEWVALMSLVNFKGGQSTNDRLTLLETDAMALLSRVVDQRRRLTTMLGQVRREAGGT